jgi:hypothetical protein
MATYGITSSVRVIIYTKWQSAISNRTIVQDCMDVCKLERMESAVEGVIVSYRRERVMGRERDM